MRFLLLSCLTLLILSGIVFSQNYGGDQSCGGMMNCHNDKLSSYQLSGHPNIQYYNNGMTPGGWVWPFSDTPPLPEVNGQNLQWSDVHYVVGNYFWKSLYLDDSGSIITGAFDDSTQWSLEFEHWEPYDPGENSDYNCAQCHTTGYDPNGIVLGYPNIVGGWALEGVQCEACHGPSAEHAAVWQIPTPGGLDCAACHHRDREARLIWKDGFILDRQEAVELSTSGMSDAECDQCHDPHKSTVYEQGGIPLNFDCSTCEGGHGGTDRDLAMDGIMEDVDCIDCHMPNMDISAGTVNEFTADVRSHIFGLLLAPIRREDNTYTIGDTTYWQVDPFLDRVLITLDYACLGCHVDNGFPLTLEEAAEYAWYVHSIPPVALNLLPREPGLVLPPAGGEVQYNVQIDNREGTSMTINYFVELTDPLGNANTIFTVNDTVIQGNGTIVHELAYQIGAAEPGGDYFFRSYLYEQGSTISMDLDVFNIEKEGGGASSVIVTLTPYGTPIQIPVNGGSFEFNIAGSNSGSTPETIDIWTMATLPSGNEFGPIINISDFTFAAGFSTDRDRNQEVPVNAPAGLYTYDAYFGSYPNTIFSEDHFEFEKLASSDNGMIFKGWNCYGEDFNKIVGSGIEPMPITKVVLSAYPNPFNPQTTLSYVLSEADNITLTLYDIQGREVATLMDGWQSAGSQSVSFDASHLTSGIYFACLNTGDSMHTRKLLLIK